MQQYPDKVDIPGYEGLYYATPEGEVFNARTGRQVKMSCNKRGCYQIHLNKNGNRKTLTMSRIMKMCFFNNTDKCIIRTEMKSDFSVWNMKLVDRNESNRMSAECGGIPVVRIKDGEAQFYKSIADCAKDNFLCASTVGKYLRNPSKKTADGAVYMKDTKFMPAKTYSRKELEEMWK